MAERSTKRLAGASSSGGASIVSSDHDPLRTPAITTVQNVPSRMRLPELYAGGLCFRTNGRETRDRNSSPVLSLAAVNAVINSTNAAERRGMIDSMASHGIVRKSELVGIFSGNSGPEIADKIVPVGFCASNSSPNRDGSGLTPMTPVSHGIVVDLQTEVVNTFTSEPTVKALTKLYVGFGKMQASPQHREKIQQRIGPLNAGPVYIAYTCSEEELKKFDHNSYVLKKDEDGNSVFVPGDETTLPDNLVSERLRVALSKHEEVIDDDGKYTHRTTDDPEELPDSLLVACNVFSSLWHVGFVGDRQLGANGSQRLVAHYDEKGHIGLPFLNAFARVYKVY